MATWFLVGCGAAAPRAASEADTEAPVESASDDSNVAPLLRVRLESEPEPDAEIVLQYHAGPPLEAVMSPDGTLVATRSEHAVQLLETVTGGVLLSLPGRYSRVDFDRSGSVLSATGPDGCLVTDLHTGQRHQPTQRRDARVALDLQARLDGSGTRVASAATLLTFPDDSESADPVSPPLARILRMTPVDGSAREALEVVLPDVGRNASLHFGGDGRTPVACGSAAASVHRVSTLGTVHTLGPLPTAPRPGRAEPAQRSTFVGCTVDAESNRVLLLQDDAVARWVDLDTGAEVSRWQLRASEFVPSGYVELVANDRLVQVKGATARRCVRTADGSPVHALTGLSTVTLHVGDEREVALGFREATRQGVLIDMETGQVLTVFDAPGAPLTMTPTGAVVTSSPDGPMLFDPQRGTSVFVQDDQLWLGSLCGPSAPVNGDFDEILNAAATCAANERYGGEVVEDCMGVFELGAATSGDGVLLAWQRRIGRASTDAWVIDTRTNRVTNFETGLPVLAENAWVLPDGERVTLGGAVYRRHASGLEHVGLQTIYERMVVLRDKTFFTTSTQPGVVQVGSLRSGATRVLSDFHTDQVDLMRLSPDRLAIETPARIAILDAVSEVLVESVERRGREHLHLASRTAFHCHHGRIEVRHIDTNHVRDVGPCREWMGPTAMSPDGNVVAMQEEPDAWVLHHVRGNGMLRVRAFDTDEGGQLLVTDERGHAQTFGASGQLWKRRRGRYRAGSLFPLDAANADESVIARFWRNVT